MSRIRTAGVCALFSLMGTSGANAEPAARRAVAFHFIPTARAQIAIWLEKPDGTFVSTVKLTQAVSKRGIGNRPGATQMNSGYHWPYGRREGVLPVWAHRRAAAPDVPGQFPRVVFQNRPEGYASRTCEDSTPDLYFCLPFSGNTHKDGLDAISCASQFNSDKGRLITPADVAAGYAEPELAGGTTAMRPLDLFSVYPPRMDIDMPCQFEADPFCRPSMVRGCKDFPDIATYRDRARAAMPDIDAVTMATPPADLDPAVVYQIPDNWSQGEYVAWVEVNTEGDYNGIFNETTFPTPMDGAVWDSWAMTSGYAYRGQPSVVFSVPFTLGASATDGTADPVGYGSVDGTGADAGKMHAMDGTITDDPIGAPGSGADRLRVLPGTTQRLQVEVRDCKEHASPEQPGQLTAAAVADPKRSHQWGVLSFKVPNSELPIGSYDVRFSAKEIVEGDETSFIQAFPALAATDAGEALMVPITGAPRTTVDTAFGGLTASTEYWIAVAAVDGCGQRGPHAVTTMKTTKVDYTKLSGCFVATAAWGSAMAPEVSALRRVRDQLRSASSLFAVGADLYYQSGPAAADLLARSDSARALVRRLIGPLGAVALAEEPSTSEP